MLPLRTTLLALGVAGFASALLRLDENDDGSWHLAPVLGVSFAAAFLVERYLRTHTAREVDALEGRAREATVTVAIPDRGVGKILFVAQGKRLSRPARTSDGSPLAAGHPVLIVSLRRHVAVVEPLPIL